MVNIKRVKKGHFSTSVSDVAASVKGVSPPQLDYKLGIREHSKLLQLGLGRSSSQN